MALTDEQFAFLKEAYPQGIPPEGTPGQSPQQAENFVACLEFPAACQFVGLDEPPPSEGDVRAALRELRSPLLTEGELLAAVSTRDDVPQDVTRRILGLYEFMKSEGARAAPGSRSMHLWIGENPDSEKANPVSVMFWAPPADPDHFWEPDGVTVSFRDLRAHRSESEIERLANLLAEVPGAREDVEQAKAGGLMSWCNLARESVFSADEAVDRLKVALVEATCRADRKSPS